jgi:argininosuccinate synthase
VKGQIKKAVLAYSGGLDTSVIVPWLKENYGCEVVTMTADLGQGIGETAGLEAKALASGASRAVVLDLREEYLDGYAFPTLQAGAVYEGLYLLGTSTARPLIARKLVEVAHREGADAVVHGCTGKGNDQVRFELGVKAHDPTLKIVAPWREWSIRSRDDAVAYAEAYGVPIMSHRESVYSRDANLWHMSHEGGILEDPWAEPEESMFCISRSPEAAPDEPQVVTIDFEGGLPGGLDGVPMGSVELLSTLNGIAGTHGVGRADLVENRLVGMKSRGVYETPGATVLYAALQGLESLCLDRETLHYKLLVAQKIAELVYYGLWFTPLREALQAFVTEATKTVTGTVRVKLYKGSATVVGRRSPFSLYREDLATFGADDVYDQSDAEGFIRLFGLPLTVKALIERDAAAVPSSAKAGVP